ncbi:MAG: DUF2490 domain-containing protein [Psychroserpens sp.]|nr:DUF2490 domain-containing protein [Psychroserpens sp.]
MNTLCTKALAFITVLLLGLPSYAQHETEVFSESAFALRKKFTNKYSVNFELSTRAFLYSQSDVLYRTRQAQISHFSALKLSLKESVALGIMYRNRDVFEASSNEFRITQQYNRKSIFKALRFGHRLRSEQRFFDDFTAFRFRYRLALDLPLQGLKLDVGETYLILTNEALLTSANVIKPEIGYRAASSLGILLSETLNLEFGLELRLGQFNIRTEDVIFFNTSLELDL